MREYAEQGIKLIVGESYAVEREARRWQAIIRRRLSSWAPRASRRATISVFSALNFEAAYLAGMLAGAMSKSGTFGSVGAVPIPEVNMLINAFQDGVKETRPDAKFIASFIGTFFDPPKAREAGLAQIDSGADILFGERIGTADAAKNAASRPSAR